jgi:aspartate racemase
MNLNEKKVIGIVGGMGPQAGLDLFKSILVQTEAKTDQEHLSTILMSLPGRLVDRTSFLNGDIDINPAFEIATVINKLETAGASVIGIACNTSHSPDIYNVVLDELNNSNSKVKLVHMPIETGNYMKINHPEIKRIGLMTTNGSYKSGLYKHLLEGSGFEVIVPDFEFQNNVIHKMIYDDKFGIKSSSNPINSEVTALLHRALYFFKQNNTGAIILGCTELSLILKDKFASGMLIIDPTKILAKALIREATKNTSNQHNPMLAELTTSIDLIRS